MASTPRLAIGTVFADDYRIVGPLAEGGMGSVYRAEQLSTHKPRAVKVVHGRLLDDERSRARFVREATVAASIASEHVVEVIAAGIDRATELPYLVMELLDGGDLAAVVKHRGRLSVPELGGMMRQLCHGLAAAHAAKVIHRDLKPENIFVAYPRHAGTAFTVKILDFGIAKVAQESKTVATLTGTVGSPLWMSPEQINNDALGPTTDVWSLGLLAFWALTGHSYWRTARAERLTVQALFAEQLFRELEPASVRAREFGMDSAIPPGFDDWFAHCVTRSAADRFADASAAWVAFEQSVDPGMRGDVSLLPPRGEIWESTSSRLSVVESTVSEAASSDSVGVATGLGTTFGGSPTIASTNAQLPTPAAAPADATGAMPSRPRTHAPRWPWVFAPVAAIGVSGGVWYALRPGPGPDPHDVRSTRVDVPPTPVEAGDTGGVQPQPPHDPTEATPPASTTAGIKEPPPELEQLPPPTPDEPIALEPVRPLPTQLSFSAAALRFGGWSSDGARFVIDATYPDRSGGDGPRNLLHLLQVHDALSSAMLESYVIERDAAPEVPERDRIARAAAEAEPYDEWEPARRALQLRGLDPLGKAPRVEVKLEAAIDASPATGRASVENTPTGLHYHLELTSAPAADEPPPHLVVHWVEGNTRWEMLDVTLSLTQQALWDARAADATPTLDGTVSMFWSPQGTRVVFVIEGKAGGVTDAAALGDARWFLRAAGPQIRLVDGGAGQRKLRRAAWALERAGLPVAAADLDHENVESSRIYVRVRDQLAAELVERIARGLAHDVPSALLSRGGWAQAVVVLGADYGLLAPAGETP
ncbi:MAG: serine/threonine protein kinase [Nannocystaceae bacterium]|nr:serine/threonine protein kinase [Nannocystaceae bacterium]